MATVTTPSAQQLDTLCINTIRTLSMDAVQAANSGHPGTPMGMAPVAYELWQEFLAYDPEDAAWPNRDRFVLSIGHASMLLYSVLHLAGVKQLDASNHPTDKLAVPLDDIKRFRQLESRCPGHPSIAGRRAWRQRPGRWVRASRTAWAWRLPSAGWRRISIVRGLSSLTTTSTRCAATAT